MMTLNDLERVFKLPLGA